MTTVTPALQSALLNLSNVYVPSVPSARGQNQTRGAYYTSEDFLQCGIMLIAANGKLYNNYVMADDAAQIFAAYDVTHDAIQTFHKSWEKVANEDYVTLLAEQIAHYFSTYGLEAGGYRALPLVPVEELIADPNARPSFKSFRPVLVMSSIGAQSVIDTTLRSTKAPHRMKMKYYEEYVKNTTLTDNDIASFELRIMWYKHNNTVPQNGQDFIRYALYTLTGATLIIKNNRTITSFKRAIYNNDTAYNLLSKADMIECAKVFHRFKPFFLAFKQEERCKPLVNRIRRLAETYHKPLSDVSIQNFSKLYNEGRIVECQHLLKNTSMRNLIKLHNFYYDRSLMVKNNNTGAFNIRNGKVHIEEDCKIGAPTAVRRSIVDAMIAKANNIYEDKIFYIPDYISYTAPTTEKQFLGTIPNGTIVCGPQDKAFSAAICWDNYKGRRTDLDLHMVGVDRSYGWNSLYRDNDENAVLYSGDMTDATYGAAEAFYFKPNGRDFVLTANNFTGEIGVPFKFFISESKPVQRNWRNGTATPPIDVETAMFPPIPLNFPDPNGCTLGMFVGSDFVFYNGSLDMGRVPDRSRYPDFIKAMKRKFNSMMSLQSYLIICGARVVSDLSLLTEEEQKKVVDLSPENLTTETLMGLVDIDK